MATTCLQDVGQTQADVTHSPWTFRPQALYRLPMDLSRQFGAAVRRHRELVRLSQEDLAGRAGLDRTYVSGIERGTRNPTLRILQRLADALGVDLDVLFASAREIASLKSERR